MVSALFDPVVKLAMSTAKKKKSIAPSRMVPLLAFKTMPDKAKEAVIEILEEDEGFRKRVAKSVTEQKHGRFAHSFLARPEGWETFVSQMLEMDAEPLGGSGRADSADSDEGGDGGEDSPPDPGSEPEPAPELVEAALRESAEIQVKETREALAAAEADNEALEAKVSELTKQVEELTEQRQRAVSELKTTESIMARHISEKKKIEATLEQMTSAQLSTAAVGGEITDIEVRVGLDAIDETLAELNGHLDKLRRASTPEMVAVARRVPLAPPLGITDDSHEFAEYLLAIPNVVVLVDGYNVTKQAVPRLDLENQRTWLEQRLAELCVRLSGRFEVIFDGADVAVQQRSGNDRVRIRFSPDGVEADDVIITSVTNIDSRSVVAVVSSDKRVREGAARGGANVLHSEQLAAMFAGV